MYQVASSKAEEFIHDGEIVETLAYARENRANRPLIEAILQKAAEGKGVTHREAAVLLECELEDLNQRMFTPPVRRATTPTTPKRWTARWKAASTT